MGEILYIFQHKSIFYHTKPANTSQRIPVQLQDFMFLNEYAYLQVHTFINKSQWQRNMHLEESIFW